ncbi:MAG TPA: transcriptional repressor [Opitutales bacterium]|nr:transcriptional repressor [Opitutales bacterium]
MHNPALMAHTHAHPAAAPETPAGLLAACRAAGLRRTHLLERVLAVLRQRDEPVNIRDLQQARGIRGACDRATLYRLLQRLEAIGLVRRIGLHERAAHFTLHRAHHHDYVVCRECGDVATLQMACPVEKLEREVGRRTGFQEIYHELQFYGVCPRCTIAAK